MPDSPELVEAPALGIAVSDYGDGGTIRLTGTIDIASAADLKRALLDALAQRQEIRVALEEIESLDVTAFQLLWAAKREAKQLRVDFTFEGELPESVLGSLRSAGLDDLTLPE